MPEGDRTTRVSQGWHSPIRKTHIKGHTQYCWLSILIFCLKCRWIPLPSPLHPRVNLLSLSPDFLSSFVAIFLPRCSGGFLKFRPDFLFFSFSRSVLRGNDPRHQSRVLRLTARNIPPPEFRNDFFGGRGCFDLACLHFPLPFFASGNKTITSPFFFSFLFSIGGKYRILKGPLTVFFSSPPSTPHNTSRFLPLGFTAN